MLIAIFALGIIYLFFGIDDLIIDIIAFIKNLKIKEISKFYLGPNISLFGAHYIAKRPFDGKPVGWHQDGSYWPLKPMNVISLWIAGSQSNKKNGCMRVIPGSQNKNLIPPSKMEKLDQEKYVLDLGIKKLQISTDIFNKPPGFPLKSITNFFMPLSFNSNVAVLISFALLLFFLQPFLKPSLFCLLNVCIN